MIKKDNYFIGIDAGSDSVGWAVTDSNYNLLRLKGKTAWGARIFSESKSAKDRRITRANRRRLARRKYRLLLLQGIFEKEMFKVDDTFFLRMSQSSYCIEDRKANIQVQCPLFKDLKTEKEFYKKYPTIWHLRKALIENEKDAFSDIRYVYLAIHHILKYRGNFLKDGDVDPKKFDYDVFKSINLIIRKIIADEQGIDIDEIDFELISSDNCKQLVKEILLNKSLFKTTKKTKIKALLNKKCDKDSIVNKYIDLFINLIVGGSFDSTKIFPNDDKILITFSGSFDDNVGELQLLFGDYYELIEKAKAIFDFVYVANILEKENFISFAYTNTFKEHKKQLLMLKQLIKTLDEKKQLKDHNREYYKMFHDPKNEHNYSAFVNVDSETKKRIDVDTFNKYVKKVLQENIELIGDSDLYNKIITSAENNEFLLKIANVSNSTIPHQLHLNELKVILQHASMHFPFIKQESSRIIDLFKFRVPYYYGPLNSNSEYSNIVLKENAKGKITPWNIHNQIDDDRTRQKFMNSLTNKCTYLSTEDVLPKESILFSDFVILNRLNSMRINEKKICNDVKKDLFEFISNRSKTTNKQIKDHLQSTNEIYKKDGVSISGLNDSDPFVSNAKSTLGKVFDLSKQENLDIAENIIFLLTVYTDNKKDALDVIEQQYKLTKEQLSAIKSLNCKGWSPLSKKLLVGIRSVDENGVVSNGTIMDFLLNTTQEFMQIYNNELYSFKLTVESEKKQYFKNMSRKDIIDTYIEQTPPIMHRTILQTIKIIDEINSITKNEPKKIIIEVTRTNKNPKEESISRKNSLYKFYKSFKKDMEYYEASCSVKSELDKLVEAKEIFRLKGKHLFLYFQQLGFDMYTGEKIDINEVLNGTAYDIDHIVPQSLIKNDSLNNTVLTSKKVNQTIKKDVYPLPENEIRNKPKVRALWKMLKERGMISDEKYNALIRSEIMSETELADFVNRQINIVNAANKVIKEILLKVYPKTNVIFSKGDYVSDVRKEYEIPKVRDLNDTHHAVDAYLNIVVGTILNDVYGDMRTITERIAKEKDGKPAYEKESFNMNHTINRYFRNKDLLNLVLRTCQRHDFLLTYRNSYQDDAFYNATINKKSNSSALIPIHSDAILPFNNTQKYGGYIGTIPEYMIVGKVIDKKGKESRILVTVPHILVASSKNEDEIKEKLIETMKSNEKIELDFTRKVYPNQKIKVNGCEYLLCTMNELTVVLKPVTPIFLSDLKYFSMIIKNNVKISESKDDFVEIYTDRFKNNKLIISKNENLKLYNELVSISFSPKYDYCPMISNIRKGTEQENIDKYMQLTLSEQIKVLQDIIKLYGRKSATISYIKVNNYFSKSKSSILKDKIILIKESATGLYRKEIVL